nr:ranbpm [Cryptomonas sp.]
MLNTMLEKIDFLSKYFNISKILYKRSKKNGIKICCDYKINIIPVLDYYILQNINSVFFFDKIFVIQRFDDLIYCKYHKFLGNNFNCPLGTNINVPHDIFRIFENLPNKWSLEDRWNWLEKKKKLDWGDIEVSFNNLKVLYRGLGKTDEDAAAIRSNTVISKKLGIFYYEVKIINSGRDGFIGIGLCSKDVDLDRLPGWEIDSIGYHGDDGHVFKDSGIGLPYGPRYSSGDIIGVCWNLLKKSIFFTKNGHAMQNAFLRFCPIKNKFMMPVVGLRTPGEIIEANFCASRFEFDLNLYIKNEIYTLLNKVIKLGKFSNIINSYNKHSQLKVQMENKNKLLIQSLFQLRNNWFLVIGITDHRLYNFSEKIQQILYLILYFEKKEALSSTKITKYYINNEILTEKIETDFFLLISYTLRNTFNSKGKILNKFKTNQLISDVTILLDINSYIQQCLCEFMSFDKFFIFYTSKSIILKKAIFQSDNICRIFSTMLKKSHKNFWKSISNKILQKILSFLQKGISNPEIFIIDEFLLNLSKIIFYLKYNLYIYSLINLYDFQYDSAIFKISLWI